MGKIVTGKQQRDIAGVGCVIDTKHEGPTRRPVESFLIKLDMWSPKKKKKPADLRREAEERRARERMGIKPSSGEKGDDMPY